MWTAPTVILLLFVSSPADSRVVLGHQSLLRLVSRDHELLYPHKYSKLRYRKLTCSSTPRHYQHGLSTSRCSHRAWLRHLRNPCGSIGIPFLRKWDMVHRPRSRLRILGRRLAARRQWLPCRSVSPVPRREDRASDGLHSDGQWANYPRGHPVEHRVSLVGWPFPGPRK